MTAMGKMLAFLVLILAVAWMAFGVNAYVTRVNWQDRATKAEAKAKEAAEAATRMKDLLESSRLAHADELRAVRAERSRLYDQVIVLAKERDQLQSQFNAAFGNAQQGNVEIKNLQTNLKSVQDQIDELDKAVVAKNKLINDLTRAAANDRVSAEESKRLAIELKQQSERLSERVQELNDSLQEYRRQYGTLQARIDQTPALPEGFRGTARSVSRAEGGDTLVTITPGADTGLRKGALLTIYGVRGGATKFIGTLQILSADPKESVGRFIPPASRGAQSRDDFPQVGDEVKPASSK